MKKLLIISLIVSFTSSAFALSAKEERIRAARFCGRQCNVTSKHVMKCNNLTQGQYLKAQGISHEQRRCMKDCLLGQKRQYNELYEN